MSIEASGSARPVKCDFSLRHYEYILKTALASGYRFVDYDLLTELPQGVRACILRHDIDYTPEWAAYFGKIEADLGIKASYFFQVCAKPYNLREQGNVEVVRKLKAWGHLLGLHFDMSWNPKVEWDELAALCAEEKRLFKAITGVEPCEVVTIHNPHRFKERVLNQAIPGLRHAYEKEWFSDIKYLSDSQGWYGGCVCKVFMEKRYDRIQLLLHPYLWPQDGDEDFVRNLARMVRWRCEDLTGYLIEHHPVGAKNEARLRQLIVDPGLRSRP
jgi:hypothetical protein